MDQQNCSEFGLQDSAGEFLLCRVYFLMKLLGFMSKTIKLLFTELVCQSKNILPLAFSALTLPLLACTEKAVGKYSPALTPHSVNKSIVLKLFTEYTDREVGEPITFTGYTDLSRVYPQITNNYCLEISKIKVNSKDG